MTAFFSNNFSEDRWRKAALTNAYALLGKQRFDHAAAFFLLAGNLKDAVEICLNKLHDLQLAIVIVRVYKGDGEDLHKLLYREVLGCDENGKCKIILFNYVKFHLYVTPHNTSENSGLR